MTYLSVALENIASAKDLHKKDDYAGALKTLGKALKRIQELTALRKDAGLLDYSVLEAPLYYL